MAGINRYNFPIKYKSRSEVVSVGVKCVFISHQRQDKEEAKKVADYILQAGIDVYFDEYDSDLKIHHQNNNPKAVTSSICKGINNSSHMLVVASPNTLTSRWVPFEIGYGFEKTELATLTLKGIPKGALPEYMRTAPVIRDIYDINKLIAQIFGKSKELLVESKQIPDFSNAKNPLIDVMDSIIND